MRHFHLPDADLVALAAGLPSAATLDELRKAQLSRHLLRLRATGTVPEWYEPSLASVRRERLADPMAALHTAATHAALRSGGSPPGPWTPSDRALTAAHDGLTLRVRLEDTDPLRSRLGLTPAPRLSPAAAERWHTILTRAWQILVTRHRPAAGTVAAVLSVIVPVEPDPGAAGISATSADAYGAVALSEPADPTALAVGLLHETQHSLLNATLLLFDLLTPSPDRSYSPWRDDPRPAAGVLHGAYAYQAVTRFWRAEAAGGGGRLAQFEFARWRQAVTEAADGLLGGGRLTPVGRRFVGAMHDEVAAWRGEPVDPDVERLATGANADHRVRWRLRNLEPDPAAVSALVAAWNAGTPPPPVPASALRTVPHRQLEQNHRLRLIHHLLRDQGLPPGGRVRPGPDAQAGADLGTGPPPYRRSDLEDLSAGDAAYLAGDLGSAFEAFLAEVAAGDDDAWSGLALTATDGIPRTRPELARALVRALPDLKATRLIRWMT